MRTFVLAARGPFSLTASTRFLEGFAPAAFDETAGRPLELPFPPWTTLLLRAYLEDETGEIAGQRPPGGRA